MAAGSARPEAQEIGPYPGPAGFRSGRKTPSRRKLDNEDLEQSVYRRLTLVCHLWPGITPFNVWELPLFVWRGFAQAADDYVDQMKKPKG